MFHLNACIFQMLRSDTVGGGVHIALILHCEFYFLTSGAGIFVCDDSVMKDSVVV